MLLAVVLSYITFIILRHVLPITTLWSVFLVNKGCNLLEVAVFLVKNLLSIATGSYSLNQIWIIKYQQRSLFRNHPNRIIYPPQIAPTRHLVLYWTWMVSEKNSHIIPKTKYRGANLKVKIANLWNRKSTVSSRNWTNNASRNTPHYFISHEEMITFYVNTWLGFLHLQ